MKTTRAGLFTIIFLLWFLAGCTPQPAAPDPTAETPSPLINFQGEYFSTAGACGYCHTGLKSDQGVDTSVDSIWRSSMMANSAWDPYYLASVRNEIIANPHLSSEIQDKCSTCHVPMAYKTLNIQNTLTLLLDQDGVLDPTHPLEPLAVDGVSCTLCHQIQADQLGTSETFSGGFLVDSITPVGRRSSYGPFPVDAGLATIMQSASGYIPVQSNHIRQSEMCATCHNLFTPYIKNDGTLSEEVFPEQTVHLEWLASVYAQNASCQDCHMIAVEGKSPIANTGGQAQTGINLHTFQGGNQYMLTALRDNPDLLGGSTTKSLFDKAIARTGDQLQNRTASLEVSGQIHNDQLDVIVKVTNLVGHKFPTSFPSRRAWLHFLVTAEDGSILFDSGEWSANGAIDGNGNDQDPTQFEGHYDLITREEEVQIYESIIGDPDGVVTTTLLRSQSYLKDNRILPIGFDKATAGGDIAVIGDAYSDPDFIGSSDEIQYQVQLENQDGPIHITVELLYQTIGYRWAENLRKGEATETNRFFTIYNGTPNAPVVIASQSIIVP